MSTQIKGFICKRDYVFAIAELIRKYIGEKINAEYFQDKKRQELFFDEYSRHLRFFIQMVEISSNRVFCRIVADRTDNEFPYFRNMDMSFIDGPIEIINYDTRAENSNKKMEQLAEKIDDLIRKKHYFLVHLTDRYFFFTLTEIA